MLFLEGWAEVMFLFVTGMVFLEISTEGEVGAFIFSGNSNLVMLDLISGLWSIK
jgi:hypothetical protein